MNSLHYVVGFSKTPMEAKERALFFYDADEHQKTVVTVESQVGTNELGESAWFTTIWYTVREYTPEEKRKEEEKFMYIGSTDIDPNDPDWRNKIDNQGPWMPTQDTPESLQEDRTEAIEVNP